MKFKGKRVGVIMGGPSSEREVSLNSGRGVLAALQQKGLAMPRGGRILWSMLHCNMSQGR